MALQDVLAGFTNPASQRSAILQRLGIDSNRAAGFGGNTQFDQSMSDLYRQGLQSSAQYDTEEGNLNRTYEQNFAQSAIDRDRALEALKGSFAQRGQSFSGAHVDEVGRTNADFDRYIANLGANRDSGIQGIGRNRLNLEQGLTSGRMAAESGYGTDLQAFLHQQAIDLWNSVMQQNAMQQPQGGGGGYSAPRPAPSRSSPTSAPARSSAPAPYNPMPAPAPAPAIPMRPAPTSIPPKPVLKGQGYGGRQF